MNKSPLCFELWPLSIPAFVLLAVEVWYPQHHLCKGRLVPWILGCNTRSVWLSIVSTSGAHLLAFEVSSMCLMLAVEFSSFTQRDTVQESYQGPQLVCCASPATLDVDLALIPQPSSSISWQSLQHFQSCHLTGGSLAYFWCAQLYAWAKSANADVLKGAQLSDMSCSDNPCLNRWTFDFEIISFEICRWSISKKLE